MEAHPGPALFHILAEGVPLRRCIWSCIEEDNHLISGQEIRIHITPVVSGIVGKIVLFCFGSKPTVGFMYKTDMCLVMQGCIKTDHLKGFSFLLGIYRYKCQTADAYQYSLPYSFHDTWI